MKKAKSEMKSVTKSMKMTADTAKAIEEAAKEANMSFSSYVTMCAMHRDKSVTPEVLCRIENIINRCIVTSERGRSEKDAIRKEADELWDLLK